MVQECQNIKMDNQLSTTYSHLRISTEHVLNVSNAEKKAYILGGFWVPYPQAESGILELEKLLQHPQIGRVPGMSLIAHTHNGKTTLIEEFMRRNRLPEAEKWEGLYRPIVFVNAPNTADTQKLYRKILVALGAKFNESEREAKLQSLVMHHLDATETVMLIIDEFHNALATSEKKLSAYLNAIKDFCVELHIPVVVAGNEKVPNALSAVEELENRLEPFVLPNWTDHASFQKVLKGIEERLPFPKPSNLSNKEIAQHIFLRTGGLEGGALLGEVIRLIKKACLIALEKDKSRLDLEIIKNVIHAAPAQRAASVRTSLQKNSQRSLLKE